MSFGKNEHVIHAHCVLTKWTPKMGCNQKKANEFTVHRNTISLLWYKCSLECGINQAGLEPPANQPGIDKPVLANDAFLRQNTNLDEVNEDNGDEDEVVGGAVAEVDNAINQENVGTKSLHDIVMTCTSVKTANRRSDDLRLR